MKYTPSINIAQTIFDPNSYIVTQNAIKVIGNIVNSFNAGVHSFNIIGSYTRVRDNILKSKEQKNIQPTKGGHQMVTCQNYVSLFYRQITSCPSDGGIS